jgi:hypothetical protein
LIASAQGKSVTGVFNISQNKPFGEITELEVTLNNSLHGYFEILDCQTTQQFTLEYSYYDWTGQISTIETFHTLAGCSNKTIAPLGDVSPCQIRNFFIDEKNQVINIGLKFRMTEGNSLTIRYTMFTGEGLVPYNTRITGEVTKDDFMGYSAVFTSVSLPIHADSASVEITLTGNQLGKNASSGVGGKQIFGIIYAMYYREKSMDCEQLSQVVQSNDKLSISHLVQDPDEDVLYFKFIKNNEIIGTYDYSVSYKYVDAPYEPTGPSTGPPEKKGLTGGQIFLVILVVFVVIGLCVFGFIYMKNRSQSYRL